VLSEVFPGGPAQAGGLREGDFVVGVDGEDVRGEPLAEVVDRIRGEPGTEVVLEVERSLSDGIFEVRLEREAIALDSVVDAGMRGGGVGYLRIRQFIEDTDVEFAEVVELLKQEGLRGLVIDLRGNPGGMLTTAVRLADLLLDRGQLIVSVQSRRGREDLFEAESDNDLFRGPLVVLIDATSASASEILAGALRDHRRAVLVGGTSFGKGSVQSVFGFPGGDGLKLTTARYLLPGGEAINGRGVFPDVPVEPRTVEAMRLHVQENHLRTMDAAAFEAAFGHPPARDRALDLAVETMRAVLAAGGAAEDR
jgi:carboxyl-terminal processing protease